MSNEVAVIQPQSNTALQAGGARMEIAAIKDRLQAVEEVMRGAMVKGSHYGTIPGCGNKPTLLKPGAEMLGMMFRLAPVLKVSISEIGNGHREYTVTCSMTSINSGEIWAEGIGSCSTMESKYRYRGAMAEDTGKPVPKAYWDAKKAGDSIACRTILGGAEFSALKDASGNWTIQKKTGKAENPDIADAYNTCLKMAKKRAQIDATLSALGCSHLFTQDLEDLPQDDGYGNAPPQGHEPPPQEPSDNEKVVIAARKRGLPDTFISEILGTDDWENAAQEKFKELADEVRKIDALKKNKAAT